MTKEFFTINPVTEEVIDTYQIMTTFRDSRNYNAFALLESYDRNISQEPLSYS